MRPLGFRRRAVGRERGERLGDLIECESQSLGDPDESDAAELVPPIQALPPHRALRADQADRLVEPEGGRSHAASSRHLPYREEIVGSHNPMVLDFKFT